MQIKFHYDRKHQFLFMKKKNFALIRLYHDYKIAIIDIIEKNYNEQFVDSFKILKKIDRLIYRLNLFSHWRIYFVFNVTQLKLCSSFTKNSFRRHRFNNSTFIFVEENIATMKFFEIERFINKRQIKKRESKYLIRWKNCDFEYDIWRNFSKLNNVMNLVNEYEKIIRRIIIIFDRLLIKNTSIFKKFFVFISSKFESNVVVISFRNDIFVSFVDYFFVFVLRKFFDIVVVVRKLFTNNIFIIFEKHFDVVVARATSSRQQKFVVIVSRKSLINVFVVVEKTFINSSIFIVSSFVRRSRRFFFSS